MLFILLCFHKLILQNNHYKEELLSEIESPILLYWLDQTLIITPGSANFEI